MGVLQAAVNFETFSLCQFECEVIQYLLACTHFRGLFLRVHKNTLAFKARPLLLPPAHLPPPLFDQTMQTLVFKNILLLFLAKDSKKELQQSVRVRRQLSGVKGGVLGRGSLGFESKTDSAALK